MTATKSLYRTIFRLLLYAHASQVNIACKIPDNMRDVGNAQDDAVAFRSYFSGKSTDTSTDTKFGLWLSGGGEDSREAMEHFLRSINYGDVVVLRANGADGYNPWILSQGASSVSTFVVRTKEAAEHPDLVEHLQRAEGVLFAGGDQSNYLLWKGTALQREVLHVLQRNGAIMGVSAGLAVMGDLTFSAQNGSISSEEAIANPSDDRITLEPALITHPLLNQMVSDSHFSQRNRLGRLVTFLAKAYALEGIDCQSHVSTPNRWLGFGVDEGTTAQVDRNGNVRVFSSGGAAHAVTFSGMQGPCLSDNKLTYDSLRITKIHPNTTYNLISKEGTAPTTVLSLQPQELLNSQD